MSSGHFEPAVRANSVRRHHKRSPVRLAGRDLDGDDNDVLDKNEGSGGLLPGLTTVVESLILPGTTVLHTEVLPIFGQPTPSVPSPATPPPSQPTPSSAPPTESSDSSSSLNSSSSSAPPSSSSSLSSSGSSSLSAAPSNVPSVPSASPALSPVHAAGSSPSPSLPGPSTTPTALDSSAAKVDTSKGLSGGAVAGIVVVVIIAVIAIAIYVVRKTLLRRRQNKRVTWSAAVFPKPDHESDIFEKARTADLPPLPEKEFIPPSVPAPPPMSYNNVISPLSPTLSPALGAPAAALIPASSNAAIVKCTFIPTLPDELSISTGETIRILNEYDDGWVLCANNRGEQGVVPIECLERTSGPKPGQSMYLGQGTGDWRMSRRESSLNGATTGATRY